VSGAGLSRLWPHDPGALVLLPRPLDPDELGLAATRLVAGLLVPAGQSVVVAIDDTLFKRRGKKVWAASCRWSIEVAIQDARQVLGAGQARNRTVRAVERTIPANTRRNQHPPPAWENAAA
jgi:hypothetical protein